MERPLRALTMSPGRVAPPPGMFSTSGITAATDGFWTPCLAPTRVTAADGGRGNGAGEGGEGPERRDADGGPAHVRPHEVHARRRLEADAPAANPISHGPPFHSWDTMRRPVKGDALADEAVERAAPLQLEFEEARRLVGALGHRQQGLHALVADPSLVPAHPSPSSRHPPRPTGRRYRTVTDTGRPWKSLTAVSAKEAGLRRLAGVSMSFRARFWAAPSLRPRPHAAASSLSDETR